MRVLVFSSLYPNAAMPQLGLFVHRRAEAVSRAGAEVRVVAPVPYFPRFVPIERWRVFAEVPDRERRSGLEVTHPRYAHSPGPGMYLQAWNLYRATLPHLRRIRREFDFDVIDAHYVYPDGVAAEHLAHKLGVPCVLTARGSDINVLPRYRLVRGQISRALRRAGAVVGVSRALADAMQELGATAERLQVVPNGVDRDLFHFGEPNEARGRLRIYSDEKMLLSVGNLNELKGHALVIEAVARLQQRGIRTSYHIVGEGEERPRLLAKIEELGLRDSVFLHGSLRNERLRPWYQAASLFVLASSHEGWPNVLNEALACGCPVIGTRVGGVPEIVRPGENGLLTDRSVDALADAIQAGITRTWDRRALAVEASRTSWNEVAERLVQLFGSLTGTPAAPAASQVLAAELASTGGVSR
jgi:glycosyltransferase involved in cell wall biosynthesis